MTRGIARRKARVWTPSWSVVVAYARMPVQLLLGRVLRTSRIRAALAAAAVEDVPFTTEQPAPKGL